MGVPRDVAVFVREQVRSTRSRIRGLVRRGVVRLANSDGPAQTVQASTPQGDEVHDGVELFEPYGFTSRPPDGSKALLFALGGDTSDPVAIAAGKPSVRLTGLASGEVALYVGGETGAKFVLRSNGDVEVTPGTGGKVLLGSPAATLAVARTTDGTQLDEVTSAWLATAALLLTDPGVLGLLNGVAVSGPYAFGSPPTGAGSITGGGQGAAST